MKRQPYHIRVKTNAFKERKETRKTQIQKALSDKKFGGVMRCYKCEKVITPDEKDENQCDDSWPGYSYTCSKCGASMS